MKFQLHGSTNRDRGTDGELTFYVGVKHVLTTVWFRGSQVPLVDSCSQGLRIGARRKLVNSVDDLPDSRKSPQ